MISPELAVEIGLNASIVLCHINYHCALNESFGKYSKDGHFWVRRSMRTWMLKEFPWWSEATVRNIFSDLEKRGLVISCVFNDDVYDRTKWYRVNYDALPDFEWNL